MPGSERAAVPAAGTSGPAFVQRISIPVVAGPLKGMRWLPFARSKVLRHLLGTYEVDDIYATCDRLMKAGVTINRPPRDGVMAFVRSPDKHSIELLQKGAAKPLQEPWKSMPNTGKW